MANACNFFANQRVNPKLFIEFAAQRVPRLFAFFDFAAGKLPFQRHGLKPRPLAHQNFAILQNQSRNHAFHRRSYSRGKEKFFQAQAVDFSSCLPTNAAQYSTSSPSSPAKAAGKWLSISCSPTTLPRTKIGTTISDLVAVEHARQRESSFTSSTTTVLTADDAA